MNAVDFRPDYLIFSDASPKDLAILGPFGKLTTDSDHVCNITSALYDCLVEMKDDLVGRDPVAKARILTALFRAYEILVERGYSEFVPQMTALDLGLARCAQTARKRLMDDMVITPFPDRREEIRLFLRETRCQS
jgi:hypothetical protein